MIINATFPSIKEITNLTGKRVILRTDFNVPLDKDTGVINDTTRIIESLPTIEYLSERGAKVIIISHLGRPIKKDKNLSLNKVADCLQDLLKQHSVKFTDKILTEKNAIEVENLNNGEILLMENIRFASEETSDNEEERKQFAQSLAQNGDIYVNDAFGASHREHASIFDIANLLPSYPGFLLEKEIKELSRLQSNPPRPFVAIIGGAKVSTKLKMLENLIKQVDVVLVGGAMAYTFLKSRALEVGTSLIEREYLSSAFQVIDKAAYLKKEFLLPIDHVIAKEFSADASSKVVGLNIPGDSMGLDIGPKTIKKYKEVISSAKTIFWNGPMGAFEMKKFSEGTMEIAKAIAKSKAHTVVGGGDSIYAARMAGIEDKINHISTGGGASLEFIEGKKLPGIVVLAKEI